MLLLDTCTLIWLSGEPGRLSQEASRLIQAETLFISAISAWEVGLKCSLGKLTLPDPADVWYPAVLAHHGITELAVTGTIGLTASALPKLHNDPADRFIIATAIRDGLSIVTPDHHIRQYQQVRVVW